MVNWPAFSRILVMLVGPAGAGARAGWAKVVVQWKRKKTSRREREKRHWLIILLGGLSFAWEVW